MNPLLGNFSMLEVKWRKYIFKIFLFLKEESEIMEKVSQLTPDSQIIKAEKISSDLSNNNQFKENDDEEGEFKDDQMHIVLNIIDLFRFFINSTENSAKLMSWFEP